MESIKAIISRSNALLAAREESSSASPLMIDLIIVLIVIMIVGLLSLFGLYFIRRLRSSSDNKNVTLPIYNTPNSPRNGTNHRRLTITTSRQGGQKSNVFVYDEKSSLASNPSSPPLSPGNVPEIRITFPDEHDESGRPKSGRVLIVRVGERGIGLEPLDDEQLPAYEKKAGERFHSIDMERIGGLKEKSSWS